MKVKKNLKAEKITKPKSKPKSVSRWFENKSFKNTCYIIVCILPVITAFLYFTYAYSVNQALSFPLDDSWIHLTFAKNLKEYFSFSYFKNEMVTAGSTSPLYTIIVAVGFFITSNEMILSYALGVIFFVLASVFFYKLVLIEFNNDLLFCLLCASVFISDAFMNFISLSGMETTLFIFLLILGSYLYKTRKAVPLSLILGLIIWTRPDGLAFAGAIFTDYLIRRYFIRDEKKAAFFSRQELIKGSVIFLGITGLYCLVNFYLSGSILPNTYNAKIAYFIDTERRMQFLTDKVWVYFTTGYYGIIMAGFIFSVLKLIFDIIKKKYDQNSMYIIFVFMFLFIYWLKLPAPNRFGRYLMPLIPFFILVSISGYKDILSLLNNFIKKPKFLNAVSYMILIIVLTVSGYNYYAYRKNYATQCRYIYDRQVKTAQWISKNTNEEDIIATHDIGAIGFYGGRRIVDVAGLITPELGTQLYKEDYSLIMTEYMKNKKATYVAFLTEWYILSNQNPVYFAPEKITQENMSVYKFDPEKTHIISKKAHDMYLDAMKFILGKDGNKIISSMNNVLALEPDYAFAYYYRAYGNQLLKNNAGYERDLQKALSIFPDFKEALLEYAGYMKNSGKQEEAKVYFLKVLEIDPLNETALANLKFMNSIHGVPK